MAFPASTLTLQKAWDDFREQAVGVKNRATILRDRSAAGDTERVRYVQLRNVLDNAVTEWAAILAGTTGLQSFARDQLEDQTLDLQVEYIAMRDATIALRDWIDANIPTHNPSGAALLRLPDDTLLTFTSAQTAGFRTEVDALLLTID